MNRKEIPNIVKTIHYRLGLTPEKFAQKVAVSFSTKNECENNKRKQFPLAIKQIESFIKEIEIKKQREDL